LNNLELALICPDPVIGIDKQGVITLFNPAAERLLGYAEQEVVDCLRVADLYPSLEVAREIKRLMYQADNGVRGQISGYKTHLKTNSGERLPIELSASLLKEEGREVGSIGFFRDLTERLTLEHSLKQLSITDSLTGLYNQRHLHTLLEQEILRRRRYGNQLSLMCIDLDNFKSVNDTLGHIEGDRVLRFMGEAITAAMRATDFGFRYGGDEFMVLLPETPGPNAEIQAARLVEHFKRHMPGNLVELNQHGTPVFLSIGIAGHSGEETAEVLIKRADLAMYRAKEQPGSAVVLAD